MERSEKQLQNYEMQSKRETNISERQGSELQSQVVTERTINVLSDKNQKELLEKSGSWGRATAWRMPQAEDSRCSTDDILSTHIGFFEFKSFYPCSFSDTGRVPQRNIFYVHKVSAEKRGEGEEREKRGERDWSHVELRKAKLWEIFSDCHSSFLALSHASPFTPSHLSLQQYLSTTELFSYITPSCEVLEFLTRLKAPSSENTDTSETYKI